MTDEQIIEIAKRLYGGNITAEDLSTHQTIEFARQIEAATREEDTRICEERDIKGREVFAAAIRSQK